MTNSKNIRWFDPFEAYYYVVFNGKKAGIYTEFEEARDAAWHSYELVEKYKTLKAAKGSLQRYIKKHKSS